MCLLEFDYVDKMQMKIVPDLTVLYLQTKMAAARMHDKRCGEGELLHFH